MLLIYCSLLLFVSIVVCQPSFHNIGSRYCSTCNNGDSIDPEFPLYGSVSRIFFEDDNQKFYNCIRSIVGKRTRRPNFDSFRYGSASMRMQRTVFGDVHVCLDHYSIEVSDEDSSSSALSINFGMVVNNREYVSSAQLFSFEDFLLNKDPAFGIYVSQPDSVMCTTRKYLNETLADYIKGNLGVEFIWPTVSDQFDIFPIYCNPSGLFGSSELICQELNTKDPYAIYDPWFFYGLLGFAPSEWTQIVQRCLSLSRITTLTGTVLNDFEVINGNFYLDSPCVNEKEGFNVNYINSGDTETKMDSEIFMRFVIRCKLENDKYTIHCLDPMKWPLFNALPADERFAMFTQENTFLGLTDLNKMTINSIRHLTWEHDLTSLIHLPERMGPRMRHTSQGGNPLDTSTPSTSFTGGSLANFFVLPHKGQLSDILSEIEQNTGLIVVQSSLFETILQRTRHVAPESANYFFMECPRFNGITCNSGSTNRNYCYSVIGRCVCEPGVWMGIACGFAVPSAGYLFVNDQVDDPNQICSTAGYLSSALKTITFPGGQPTINVKVCECLPGFMGTPLDWKSSVPLYASLFHDTIVSNTNNVNHPIWINSEWFTPFLSHDFNIQYSDTTAKTKLLVDWYKVVYYQQCFIYIGDPSKPPVPYEFDKETLLATLSVTSTSVIADTKILYPWPSLSKLDRHGNQVGIQGLDMKQFDWLGMKSDSDLKVQNLGFFMNDILPTLMGTTVSLWGGKHFQPCPDCDREHSDCVTTTITVTPVCTTTTIHCIQGSSTDCICSPPRYVGMFYFRGSCSRTAETCTPAQSSVNVCKCDDNYKGTLCNEAICHSSEAFQNRACSGNGVCNADTGTCNCHQGWTGIACDVPLCTMDSNQTLCSGQGICVAANICQCNVGKGGVNCERAACPFFNGLECAGATDSLGNSVCDVQTLQCDCSRTLYQRSPSRVPIDGWPNSYNYNGGFGGVDNSIYLAGRWGKFCEHTYAEACRDPATHTWFIFIEFVQQIFFLFFNSFKYNFSFFYEK